MKKLFFILCILSFTVGFSQDHFAGINTSNRVGILNVGLNPAELPNLSKKFEVNIYGLSFNLGNNKVGYKDITSDTNLEDLIFTGEEPVNLSFDGEVIGPSVAFRLGKWGFGLTTKANAKFDLVDIDTAIGDAISNGVDNIVGTTTINSSDNQRMNGTLWGEIGLSVGKTVFENEKHRFNAGATIKLLFPGSYSNFGLKDLNGTVTNIGGEAYLQTDEVASLNIAYSGNLADSFTNFDDYTKSFFGNFNGFATDLGVNYQWKDGAKKYRINTGLAIRNIGSMTFKDDNNYNTSYELNIQPTVQNPLGLNLNELEDVDNLNDVETILYNNGYLTITPKEKEFKVKLPTVFSAYIDLKIVPKVYVTLYTQQKLNNNNDNDQITAKNSISVTPRVNFGFFEAYTSWSQNEVSGLNGGIGFRLGGFYIGSSSVVTALLNDSKQADLHTGFRWAFL